MLVVVAFVLVTIMVMLVNYIFWVMFMSMT